MDTGRNLNGILSAAMIKGVGISARENAKTVLDGVMNWDEMSLKEVDAGLVEAYFYLSMSKAMDRRAFIAQRVNTDWSEEYESWINTEEGKILNNWLRDRLK